MQQWYYSTNGAQSGPVSLEQLSAMLANGSLRSDTLVWCEGMTEWLTAATVPQLQSSLAPSAPPLPQMPYAPNPYAPPQSPAAYPGPGPGRPIPSYLWQSIVVTLLCCIPCGVAAIVYASKVDSLSRAGDWAGAQKASDSAKKWCWVSFWIGVIFVVLSVLGNVGTAVRGN